MNSKEGFVIKTISTKPLQHALQALCIRVARSAPLLFIAASLAVTTMVDAAETPAAKLALKSSAALVLDQESGQILYGKNANAILPIASITKVMTAMVVLDANLDAQEAITVTNDDVDWLRGSHSRLQVGAVLTREEMLRLALMSSENRAASRRNRRMDSSFR